jgi:hypothetical protein
MKQITFSAEDELLDAASERARAAGTTLEAEAHKWLVDYAEKHLHLDETLQELDELRGKARVGRKLTRDEMNER